jgi:hypothetical protein
MPKPCGIGWLMSLIVKECKANRLRVQSGQDLHFQPRGLIGGKACASGLALLSSSAAATPEANVRVAGTGGMAISLC